MPVSVIEQLKSGRRLPSPKGVVIRLIELSQREDASVAQVAHLIQADPALAGRLVKAANCVGANPPSRPLIAVGDAILRLGLPSVFQLALGFSLATQLRGSSAAFDHDRYWSRSLLQAVAARALAVRVGLVAPEEAFICGLLANVGQLAMASAWPEQYPPLLKALGPCEDPLELARAEREALAVTSGEVTVHMLGDWGFPLTLTRAIEAHTAPEAGVFEGRMREERLSHLLHVAALLADLGFADCERRRRGLADVLFAGARLGVDDEVLGAMAPEVLEQWRSWCPIFELDPQGASFEGLGEQDEKPVPAASCPPAAMNPGLRLLVVDSDAHFARQLAALLVDSGHAVRVARGGDPLVNLVGEGFDCALIEWGPAWSASCRALRATRMGRRLQVIAMGTPSGEEALAAALEAGADDYLAKPFSPRVLEARLAAIARVARLQTEADGDLEELRRFSRELAVHNRRLQVAAETDELTGLARREAGLNQLERVVADAEKSRAPVACLIVDIDALHPVNERFGRIAGDRAVAHVAKLIAEGSAPLGKVSRFSGEEFLVVMPGTTVSDAQRLAESLHKRVAAVPLATRDAKIDLTVSVGVAVRDPGAGRASELVGRAFEAADAARRDGGNRVVLAA